MKRLLPKPAKIVNTSTCDTEYIFLESLNSKTLLGVYSYDEIWKDRKNGRKRLILRFSFHASRFRWLREVRNDVRGRARSFVFRLKYRELVSTKRDNCKGKGFVCLKIAFILSTPCKLAAICILSTEAIRKVFFDVRQPFKQLLSWSKICLWGSPNRWLFWAVCKGWNNWLVKHKDFVRWLQSIYALKSHWRRCRNVVETCLCHPSKQDDFLLFLWMTIWPTS